MQAPPNFQPKNILQGDKKLPPAARARYRKFDIYRDVSQFGYVDTHAVMVCHPISVVLAVAKSILNPIPSTRQNYCFGLSQIDACKMTNVALIPYHIITSFNDPVEDAF